MREFRLLTKKQDLDRQLSRLVEYAVSCGLQVKGAIKEVGSGLNGKRTKLLSILRDSDVKIIIVEHKDRLVLFGFEYIESLLMASGRKIIVVDNTENETCLPAGRDDLVQVKSILCKRKN